VTRVFIRLAGLKAPFAGKIAERLITEDDTEVFQILISQVAKDGKINAIFGKALRVFRHAEFFEPVRNLLHRRPHMGASNPAAPSVTSFQLTFLCTA
jgi:hypothetical protein